MSKIIPEATKLAAKRGFIRTFCQALSSAIPIGAIALTLTTDALIGAAVAVGGTLISAGLAGLASYLDITASGIPDEYVDGWISDQTPLDTDA